MTTEVAQQFLQLCSAHLVPDDFGVSHISSLYFDTPYFELIEKSLDKPSYKEKIRIRSYDEGFLQAFSSMWQGVSQYPYYSLPQNLSNCAQDASVFLELKKKFKGIVYKERINTNFSQAIAYLQTKESCSNKENGFLKELDQFKKRNPVLLPSILIRTNRKSFKGASPCGQVLSETSNDNVRITFDTQLWYKNVRNEITDAYGKQASWQSLIAPNKCVMEIKSSYAYPLWLTSALDACKIYPGSFSKYGQAYLLEKVGNQISKHQRDERVMRCA